MGEGGEAQALIQGGQQAPTPHYFGNGKEL